MYRSFHLCISVPPKYALSTMVGYLKGKSAIVVFEKYSKVSGTARGTVFGHAGTTSVQSAWMRHGYENISKLRKSTSRLRASTIRI